MLVTATRTLWALALRALFYGVLFLVVVFVHLAITGALRQQGLGGAFALTVSGAFVLGVVLLSLAAAEMLKEREAAAWEAARAKQGLPEGACCVVGEWSDDEEAMQWAPVAPLAPTYPKVAQRFGIEGVAVVDFEVSAEGRAKAIQSVDAWPTEAFFKAARRALREAQFEPKPDVHARYGEVFRMSFVFRLHQKGRIPRAAASMAFRGR
jgi:TonB family protein